MTHHGVKYQEGLNEDTRIFEPYSTFFDRLIFASKDILAFLWDGTLIADVEVPENERIIEVVSHGTQKFMARRIILTNIRPITLGVIKELVAEGVDIHAGNDYAILWSAKDNHIEILKYLSEQGADIHVWNDFALLLSEENGHEEVVKYLVEHGAVRQF